MSTPRRSNDEAPRFKRIARLAVPALAVAAGLATLLIVPPWLSALVNGRDSGRIAVGFLTLLRVAHAAALLGGPLAAIVLATILWQARRRGRRRLRVARGLLAVVAGLVGLVLVEALGALWWSGSHRPPPIVPTAEAPPVVAEGLPRRFPEATPAGEVNLVVIGGSSARGVPFERRTSVGPIVAWQLGRIIPGRRFRVTILAGDGQKLDDQHRKLAGLRRRPDALVVYSGHNEFQSRFAWGREADHYPDQFPDPSRPRLAPQFGDTLPLGQIILETMARHRLAIPPSPLVTRQLVDVPCCTRAEFRAILDDFRRRLEAIVADCERVGTLAILVIPPGNDADFEPNRSVLPRATPRAARASFAASFAAARRLEATDPAGAAHGYRALLERQPGFAEAHYRLARLLERAGDRPAAARHFIRARDHDGQPVRCPSAFQQIYRDMAARHPSALLIDGPAYLRDHGPSGLLDDHLFADGFHPSFLGHLLLAQAILDGLHARRALDWPSGTAAPTIAPASCAAHFGLDRGGWRAACAWSARFYEASAFLRYDPSDRLAKARRYARAARRLAAGEPPSGLGIPGLPTPANRPAARPPRPASDDRRPDPSTPSCPRPPASSSSRSQKPSQRLEMGRSPCYSFLNRSRNRGLPKRSCAPAGVAELADALA